MKILLLSDTHYAEQLSDPELQEVLEGQISLNEKLDRVLIQEDVSTYDFMVVSGDLVHEGTAEDYQGLKALLFEKFPNLPIYFALGNHDIKHEFHQGMFDQENGDNYDHQMTYGGIHFLFLDSSKRYTHSGEFADEQLEWIKGALAENDLPKVIFQHHPIFGGDYFANFVFEDPEPIMQILAPYEVLAIFTGHTHSPALHVQAGIKQYTTYAMSFGLEKLANGSQAFTDTCGYTMIDIQDKLMTVAPRMVTPAYRTMKVTDPVEMVALNHSYEFDTED